MRHQLGREMKYLLLFILGILLISCVEPLAPHKQWMCPRKDIIDHSRNKVVGYVEIPRLGCTLVKDSAANWNNPNWRGSQ